MEKYSLFLDSVTDTFYCGCFDEAKGTWLFSSCFPNNVENCNCNLANLFKSNGLSFCQIDKICLTIGPGTYTGLRIGGVICRTWCNIFGNCSLYTISSLRLQANARDVISAISLSKNKKDIAVFNHGEIIYRIRTNLYLPEINSLKVKFPDLEVLLDYHSLNLFDIFSKNRHLYQQLPTWTDLKLLYD